MHRSGKVSIVLLVMVALLTVPVAALAAASDLDKQDPQIAAGSMIADVLVVRPLSIVATAAGFGFFVVSAPFSLLGGNVGEAWSALVVYPVKFTFTRPLGDFD